MNTLDGMSQGGSRGGSVGSLELNIETKLFHFHGESSEPNREKITNNHVQLSNRTSFVNLNPLSRNSGSAPVRVHMRRSRKLSQRWSNFDMFFFLL